VSDIDDQLLRWTRDGVIEEATAGRIRAYERDRAGTGRLRWPILVALAFGGLLVATGILLFVSAHWDELSPGSRFALVLLLVAVFHIVGAYVADRFPAMSATFHAIGTVTLGAGIFLAGQIFHLEEHWPGGVMVWALGAAVATALLPHAPQAVLLAILAPLWLACEWVVATGDLAPPEASRVLAGGVLLQALAYLTSRIDEGSDSRVGVLPWVGAAAVLPAAGVAAVTTAENWHRYGGAELSATLRVIGWSVAFGVPMLVAYATRGRAAWTNAVAALWVVVLFALPTDGSDLPFYAWWALGATALVAWAVADGRLDGINLGAAIFAVTVGAYYFSNVMDKLGRSASLVSLGLLFLGGGWLLERVRRRLISHVRGQL
jgi:hypothetical protein